MAAITRQDRGPPHRKAPPGDWLPVSRSTRHSSVPQRMNGRGCMYACILYTHTQPEEQVRSDGAGYPRPSLHQRLLQEQLPDRQEEQHGKKLTGRSLTFASTTFTKPMSQLLEGISAITPPPYKIWIGVLRWSWFLQFPQLNSVRVAQQGKRPIRQQAGFHLQAVRLV